MQFFDRRDELAIARELLGLVFRIQQLAVNFDIKNAAGSGHEFRVNLVVAEPGLKLRHQTGGLWKVVSRPTPGDTHFHRSRSVMIR